MGAVRQKRVRAKVSDGYISRSIVEEVVGTFSFSSEEGEDNWRVAEDI